MEPHDAGESVCCPYFPVRVIRNESFSRNDLVIVDKCVFSPYALPIGMDGESIRTQPGRRRGSAEVVQRFERRGISLQRVFSSNPPPPPPGSVFHS